MYHLTRSQKLVYEMEKYVGDGRISIICGSMLSAGNETVEQMQKAVNKIYCLNHVLRTRIVVDERGVNQEIYPYYEKEYEVLRFKSKEELDFYAESYAKVSLDLYGELCETKIIQLPDQYGVLIKLHHLIGDAWTLALLGNQFNALIHGIVPEVYPYQEHIEDEDKYTQSKRYEKDKKFFLEQFTKCTEPIWLSEDRKETYSAKRETFIIEKEEAKKISDYVAQKNTSAFMMFTAALSVYMNRIKMNAERYYIGTAVLNRSTVKEKNTAGMFVNTAPILIELDNAKSFAENMNAIEVSAFSVLRHQKFNYGDVLTNIRKEYGFSEKLFDVMLSYQNATVTGELVETTWYSCRMQTDSLQIHIDDRDEEGIFRIHYDYLIDRFTEEDICKMHSRIKNILFSAIEDDTRRLCELTMLSDSESKKILKTFNSTPLEYSVNECVHYLIEKHVQKSPEKVAVVAKDATLTYAELNEQANRIAHYLNKHCKEKSVIAVLLPRKSYLLAAILGVLKCGSAYMPIFLQHFMQNTTLTRWKWPHSCVTMGCMWKESIQEEKRLITLQES